VYRPSCKVTYPSYSILMKLEFSLGRFYKNKQISNFMKTPSLRAEFFHIYRRTDGHDTNRRFSQFCESESIIEHDNMALDKVLRECLCKTVKNILQCCEIIWFCWMMANSSTDTPYYTASHTTNITASLNSQHSSTLFTCETSYIFYSKRNEYELRRQLWIIHFTDKTLQIQISAFSTLCGVLDLPNRRTASLYSVRIWIYFRLCRFVSLCFSGSAKV
jgi:hypothetical protein